MASISSRPQCVKWYTPWAIWLNWKIDLKKKNMTYCYVRIVASSSIIVPTLEELIEPRVFLLFNLAVPIHVPVSASMSESYDNGPDNIEIVHGRKYWTLTCMFLCFNCAFIVVLFVKLLGTESGIFCTKRVQYRSVRYRDSFGPFY